MLKLPLIKNVGGSAFGLAKNVRPSRPRGGSLN